MIATAITGVRADVVADSSAQSNPAAAAAVTIDWVVLGAVVAHPDERIDDERPEDPLLIIDQSNPMQSQCFWVASQLPILTTASNL